MRHDPRSVPIGAAFALGFALSGFFDGILLHQILGWHHLLSALGGDARFQVAADGWFHAGMYAVAAFGLWLLWRGRDGLRRDGAGARLAGWGLLGFGAWHAVDAVGSHWLLGIHRIRMDAADPLAWDVGWLVVFGGLPALAGWRLLRRGGTGGGHAAAMALVGAVLVGGAAASRPPAGPSSATLAFAPGVSQAEMVAAIARSGARLIWTGDGVATVDRLAPAALPGLARDGLRFAGGGVLPVGCLGWSA